MLDLAKVVLHVTGLYELWRRIFGDLRKKTYSIGSPLIRKYHRSQDDYLGLDAVGESFAAALARLNGWRTPSCETSAEKQHAAMVTLADKLGYST